MTCTHRFAVHRHFVFQMLYIFATVAPVIPVFVPSYSSAAELTPATSTAFQKCLTQLEADILKRQSSTQTFVLSDSDKSKDQDLAAGTVVIREGAACNEQVSGGLVHHWIGEALLPGAKLQDVLAVIRDIPNFPVIYKPQVLRGQVLSETGNERDIKLRLKRSTFLVTAVLDGVYNVQYGQLDPSHSFSISHSKQINQLKNPGEPNERAMPIGRDDGYLWSLNTYWRLEQRDNGVLAECETISLTRDIPGVFKPVAMPFVTSIPKESLEFTLKSTRNAVQAAARK